MWFLPVPSNPKGERSSGAVFFRSRFILCRGLNGRDLNLTSGEKSPVETFSRLNRVLGECSIRCHEEKVRPEITIIGPVKR